MRRRGKHLIVETTGGLALLMHLMSAGRLQLYESAPARATARRGCSCASRDGRELRLREFGSKQAAWVKLLRAEELEGDERSPSSDPKRGPSRRRCASC